MFFNLNVSVGKIKFCKKTLSILVVLLILVSLGCVGKRDLHSNNSIKKSGKSKKRVLFKNPKSDNLIVFIHGFSGDPVESWTFEDSNFFWPKKLSKDPDFKNSDIYSFGYKSDCGTVYNIRQIAASLKTVLDSVKTRYKTISFVAHSLGGIAARYYILENYRDINLGTVALLSSPNFSSGLINFPEFLCDNAHLKELMEGIAIDDLNDRWRREFLEKQDREPFNLAAAYELNATPFIGVVVEKNAAVNFARQTRGFLKNHSNMAKPYGVDDELYIWIKQRLLQKPVDRKVEEALSASEERSKDIIQDLRARLKGAYLDKIYSLVAVGNRKEALKFLSQHERKDDRNISKIAEVRFIKARVYELDLDYLNSRKYYEEAVRLAPDNTDYLNGIGDILNKVGEYDTAINYYKKALKGDLKKYGPNHPNVADRWNNLGAALYFKGQYDEAINYYEKALNSDLKTFGLGHPTVATRWNNLGSAWYAKGDSNQAISYYDKALSADLKTFGPSHPNVATRWNNLGAAWYLKKNYDKAIYYYKKALASDLKTFGADHPTVATDWNNLGGGLRAKGQYDRAIFYYEKAFNSDLKTFGSEHPNIATYWNNLGSAWNAKGNKKKAIDYYKKAVAVFKKYNLHHRVKSAQKKLDLILQDRKKPSF
jgi:tetratricopeptide (TPR) repeat protein